MPPCSRAGGTSVFPIVVDDTIDPFSIDVSEEVLADLHQRLEKARFPAPAPGEPWAAGTDLEYLQSLCRYWKDGYDWRAQEAVLNGFAQYRTTIDGQTVHFMHVRSPEPRAFPLLLTHGWPGSVAEFVHVFGPLADPRAHGGDPADAFDVICPSLPGFAFSGPTTEPGWDARRIARAWAVLMSRLGYDRYGAQGGDWGAMVSSQLALIDEEHLVGLHLNFVIATPPSDFDYSTLDAAGQAALADMASYLQDGSGYVRIQSTRPQTLGYGLDDSPVGLAGWIVEKFRAWTDCDGVIERAVSRDDLLTNLMLYWVTATAHSAARIYYESEKTGCLGPVNAKVTVPTGCAIFPRELLRPPRAWADRVYNVTRWTEMQAGGHFAALEQPEVLAADIRTFFRPLR